MVVTTGDDPWLMIFFLIGMCHFLGIGIVEFHHLEAASGNIQTFADALYLGFVLLTTVGYGNTIAPSTPTSRLFTVAYSAYGLLIFGAGTSIISEAIVSLVEGVKSKLGSLLSKAVDNTGSKHAAEDEAEEAFEPPQEYHNVRDMNRNFLVFLVLNFTSAAIFTFATEEDWNFGDGLYHCFMTATTIGLGDIAPTSQGGRVFAVFNMIVSVILFGTIIGSILGALERRKQDHVRHKMLEKQLDTDLITSLDKDGDGVDRAEFVLGMLVALGTITEDDYKPFLQQFDRLDTNGDKTLSKEDLVAIASANQQAHAAETEKAHKARNDFKYAHKVGEHVKELIVPTGVACMGFVWHNVPGYLLLLAGLLNLQAIQMILGSRPNLKTYRSVMCMTGLNMITLLTAIVLFIIVMFVNDPFKLDLFPISVEYEVLGKLDDSGRTRPIYATPTQRETFVAVISHGMKEMMDEVNAWRPFAFIMFLLVFFYMFFVEVKVVMCCFWACAELRKAELKTPAGPTDEQEPSAQAVA